MEGAPVKKRDAILIPMGGMAENYRGKMVQEKIRSVIMEENGKDAGLPVVLDSPTARSFFNDSSLRKTNP